MTKPRRKSATVDPRVYGIKNGELIPMSGVTIDRTNTENLWSGTVSGGGTLNVLYCQHRLEWYFCFTMLKAMGTVRATMNCQVLELVLYFKRLGFSIPDQL